MVDKQNSKTIFVIMDKKGIPGKACVSREAAEFVLGIWQHDAPESEWEVVEYVPK